MLTEIHGAATSGHDFDPVDGHKTVRFSYAGSTADMEEALERIAGWLRLRLQRPNRGVKTV